MKILLAAAIAVAAPALAQTAAAPAPAPAATPAAKYTLDTPLETLQADPAAKAVVTANLGSDIALHPMYESFKAMSLNQLAPMSAGAITPETLAKVAAGLAAIK